MFVATLNLVAIGQPVDIFAIFKMAAVHHLGFLKFEILMVDRVQTNNMRHRAKFQSIEQLGVEI